MTLGTSIFLIAVFISLFFIARLLTKKKKWKMILKIFGGLLALGLLVTAAVFAYFWYTERPEPLSSLGEVSIGMRQVDVTLALGRPDQENKEGDSLNSLVYSGYGSSQYDIKFDEDRVSMICTNHYGHEVFGLGVYDSEKKVLKKLGEPTNTSINESGLLKFISYEEWKVAFQISEGEVNKTCVSETGKIGFTQEHSSLTGEGQIKTPTNSSRFTRAEILRFYFSKIDEKDFYTTLNMMSDGFKSNKTIQSMAAGYKDTENHLVKDINCTGDKCLVNFTAKEKHKEFEYLFDYVNYLMEFVLIYDEEKETFLIKSAKLISSS